MTHQQHFPLPDTLPLPSGHNPQHKDLVKQHWNVTFARQTRISVVAKRIMARVFDQIRDDDFQLRDHYQLTLGDITDCAGISRDNAYREVEAALSELAAAAWVFKNVDSDEWEIRNLLDTTKPQPVGYKNGNITVLLNPQLSRYFIQIAHYTTYGLDDYMKLRSWYSMRLYEILSAFRDTGFWEVSIEEYRQLLDCGYKTDKRKRMLKNKEGQPLLKYPNVNDLISNTTTEPLSELADTKLAFQVKPRLEAQRVGRGRRKIVGLHFELLNPVRKEIPAHWFNYDSTKALIEKLRSWKVSDKNIALYAEVLKEGGIKKLTREWDAKERSDRRIDSKEKYCNAAFVRVAKKQMEETRRDALQAKQNI